MSTVPDSLSFKFHAYFQDGTEIIQTDADKSSIKEGKSAFFDVLEKLKDTGLNFFSLSGEKGIYTIDFINQKFIVGVSSFSMLGQDEVINSPKLIYFREVLQHNTMKDGTQPPYVARYFLGFEGKNGSGEVVKKIINIEA